MSKHDTTTTTSSAALVLATSAALHGVPAGEVAAPPALLSRAAVYRRWAAEYLATAELLEGMACGTVALPAVEPIVQAVKVKRGKVAKEPTHREAAHVVEPVARPVKRPSAASRAGVTPQPNFLARVAARGRSLREDPPALPLSRVPAKVDHPTPAEILAQRPLAPPRGRRIVVDVDAAE